MLEVEVVERWDGEAGNGEGNNYKVTPNAQRWVDLNESSKDGVPETMKVARIELKLAVLSGFMACRNVAIKTQCIIVGSGRFASFDF